MAAIQFQRWKFQSTPSARRATGLPIAVPAGYRNFNPRPPRGERQIWQRSASASIRFQSTPSARRATVLYSVDGIDYKISIHALREESDYENACCYLYLSYFNPRPPRGERRTATSGGSGPFRDFNPRPPRGERPAAQENIMYLVIFQSTPSARRATVALWPLIPRMRISIHALREESDKCRLPWRCPVPLFQSTPSARRATDTMPFINPTMPYFNPRPPRGERQHKLFIHTAVILNFNPRPPRGERRGR